MINLIKNKLDIKLKNNKWMSESTKEKAHSWIEAVVGVTILYHHNTRRSNDDELIDENNGGLLFTQKIWTRGVGKKGLGISSFEERNHDVSDLITKLVDEGIVETYKERNFLDYLSSLGRLLQPEINGLPAIDWLTQTIKIARTESGLKPLDSKNGLSELLPWGQIFNGDSKKTPADFQQNWHQALRDIFHVLTNPDNWPLDGTLSTLLSNQPCLSGPRRIVLFKLVEGRKYVAKLCEDVDLPVAQYHSNLLNCLHNRDNRNTLDDETQARMRVTVDELRELNAMVIRLDDQEGPNISSTSADTL